jgi:signal transduction histidine kinase
MHDLTHFSLADMLEIGAHLRGCCNEAASLQATAERIVRYLYQDLRDAHGARATALVRFFLTRPLGSLPAEYREVVLSTGRNEPIPEETPCLSLLATAGLEPDWNSPPASPADLAIPLVDSRIGATAPMIGRLFEQFGVDLAAGSQPGARVLPGDTQRTFKVFHVAQARGSADVPAQSDFVERYDICSVIAFGGLLASGDLFAVIAFTTVPVAAETAELFQPLALSTKLALAPFAHGPIFPGEPRANHASAAAEREWRMATLEQLIDLHESTAIEQSRRLEERATSEHDARQALHRVNERNLEYLRRIRELNESLAHQVDQLEAVNQELEAFSYSVSHDLRAPLRHLSGFADLLGRENLDQAGGNARRYVQFIREASTHAGKLVDDLLQFARMGRVEIRRSRVDMSALIRLVIRELEPDIGNRDVTWRVDDLPSIAADPAMIALVVKNLLSNALKFTATREQAIIAIDATRDERETRFRVRDNGIGFDMQYVDKLFKVFQRLHRSEDFAGSGIGLAHVQRIVRRHGGRAWAEGAVDQGASFFFSVPNEAQEVTDGRN